MSEISWTVSEDDAAMIQAIVGRAEKDLLVGDRMTLVMDLTACHANGTPIDLVALVLADYFTFSHDVCGIQRHINRETGQLEDCFVPRTAAKYTEDDDDG